MYRSAKSQAAAQRSADHRRREDEAQRLSSVVPSLKSLRIEIAERAPTGTTKHVKLIVVASAPALFIVACGDSMCKDGGHDITREILLALRDRKLEHQGESGCGGTTGSAPCTRSITYRMSAEYDRTQDANDSAPQPHNRWPR